MSYNTYIHKNNFNENLHSSPLAGQNSGHIDAPNTNTNTNNTYNSNQTLINSFAGDTSVMP